MLFVTVEIWPMGDREQRREIARVKISNATGIGYKCDYHVWAQEESNPVAKQPKQIYAGLIEDHDCRQSVFVLLAKATLSIADSFLRKRNP